MEKKMSAKNASPLEQLMGGGVVLPQEAGKEKGYGPFLEALEDGWTVVEPSSLGLGERFAGVNFEKKLMVVPSDETRGALVTRIHELGHPVFSPHEDLPDLEMRTGIPASVLNAFEDGRVNGKLREAVPVFDEAIGELPFPIDVEQLKQVVSQNTKAREADATHQGFSDNEVRAFGACLMAASEVYSPEATKVWESIADATLMSPEQKAYVVDACHRLPSMSHEQMVDEIQHLMNLLVEDIEPPPPPPPPPPALAERPGVGPVESDDPGKDHDEEDSGTDAIEGIDPSKTEVAKVERPKPKPLPPQAKSSLQRVGSRVAMVNAMAPRAANALATGRLTARTPTAASPEYKARTIASTFEYKKIERKEEEEARRYDTATKASGRGDELTKDFGVTIPEENWVATRMGRYSADLEWVRPEMKHREFPLEETVTAPIGNPRRAKKHDRVGYMTSPWRAHIDGRVFRRKMRVRRLEPAGAILLDLSGSMSPSSKLIRRCLEIAPYAVVGAYAGNDGGRGSFAVVAQNRKCVSQEMLKQIISEFGGGNSVDYEALEWLSRQKGPRIWISDGFACGSGSNDEKNAHMCFQLCRDKEIIRIPDLRMLVGEQSLKNNLSAAVGR